MQNVILSAPPERATLRSGRGYPWLILMLWGLLMGCGWVFNGATQSVTLLSYNVKAAFDDTVRAARQSERIADVINLALAPATPDIIILQEIEGRAPIEELIENWLIGRRYQSAALSPPIAGRLQIALISRYPIQALRYHGVYRATFPLLRGILEAQLEINGNPLYLFMVHLKSKREGAQETEPLRIAMVEALQQRLRVLLKHDPEAAIIIAGDFNERTDEYRQVNYSYPTALLPPQRGESSHWYRPLRVSQQPIASSHSDDDILLFSPWNDSEWEGSYYYNNAWQQIDHFLLSSSLLTTAQLRYDSFRVITAADLLTAAGHPNPYYSDHLPLLLALQILEQ